ncbi:phosphatidate cytidylyltransferase [Flavobacterium sp. MK4S-17]|uniref:phosphatidate cytidylyltransferase n=1 Tax=Flavobacterium sp. MK4S-17 TaxID=2543737 RepID=UPI001358A15C|nr:phosphatidate cytidylyltransferase [Flavobacterium sp. MK4S-17]
MNESITRALSGIVYVSLLITATLISPISFIILFGIFMLIAIAEFCRLVSLNWRFPIFLGVLCYAVFILLMQKTASANLFLSGSACFIAVMLLAELFSKKTIKKDTAAKFAQLAGYIIIPFILIMRLPFSLSVNYTPYIIIGIFILIWVNDTFAYIVGKSMGRHKLFQRISPKKTIEGFLGGMVFTIGAGYIISMYYNILSAAGWMASAAIIVIFGTLGDLTESKLKRTAGVKDSGNIMPGHGGILDRLDSVIFAIPFLFLYYQIIHYVS